MRKIIATVTFMLMLVSAVTTAFAAPTMAPSRIKDIAKVQGMRSNQLVGYGLVFGLSGTGDSNKSVETLQSVASMLKEFGVAINTSTFKTKNVAAVMVTAQLPPYVREGDTIDITVSSMGDAKSLQGGTLVQTPLRAANGQVYAVGQGAVSTGGFAVGRGGSGVQKNFLTVGTTPNGAIVEKSVEGAVGSDGQISLSLSKADFTTANRIAGAINSYYGAIARATNPGRVDISVPSRYQSDVVSFVSSIEELRVVPDNQAKVIVNERTGTIIMGGNVAVDQVAITQGALNISIVKGENVNQPEPFSMGRTVTTKNTDVKVDEKAHSIVLPATTNVNDVVGALNAVGATSRDIISVLQAIKAAGALHADLEII